MLNPSRSRSSAWALPASYASSGVPVAPSAMFPGSTTAPSSTRTTLPPSWSTAMNGGTWSAISARSWSFSRATCSAPSMFRLNRQTPPTARPRTSWVIDSSTYGPGEADHHQLADLLLERHPREQRRDLRLEHRRLAHRVDGGRGGRLRGRGLRSHRPRGSGGGGGRRSADRRRGALDLGRARDRDAGGTAHEPPGEERCEAHGTRHGARMVDDSMLARESIACAFAPRDLASVAGREYLPHSS